LSAAQPQLLPATSGSTQFELLLLALTARLSQWPQLERQAEQVGVVAVRRAAPNEMM
jgi:hypothetical protein